MCVCVCVCVYTWVCSTVFLKSALVCFIFECVLGYRDVHSTNSCGNTYEQRD